MFQRLVLVCILSSIVTFAAAQHWDYPFTQLSKKEGLPSNTIYCVASDTNNVLWIGTDVGLVKYDGYNIKVFNTDNGLPSNDIFEIVLDKKNRLWLTTLKDDITYIKEDKIYTKSNDTLIKKIHNKYSFPRYFVDSKGVIWLHTIKFELIRIGNDNLVQHIKFDFETISAGYNIIEYKNKIYFTSARNNFYIDVNTNKIKKIDGKILYELNGINITNDKCYILKKDNSMVKIDTSTLTNGMFASISSNWTIPQYDSFLWTKSQHGFLIYNINNIQKVENILPKNQVSNIFKDDNVFWLSTLSSGIYKLNSMKIKNFPSSVSDNKITFNSIYTDNTKIYAGTNKGEIFLFERNNPDKFSMKALSVNSLTNNRALKIIKHNSDILVATDRGILRLNIFKNKSEFFQNNNTSTKNLYVENNKLVQLDNVGVRFLTLEGEEYNTLVDFKKYYSYTTYQNKKIVGSQDSLYYINNGFRHFKLNIPFNYRALDLLVKDSLLIATTAEKGVFFIQDSIVKKNLDVSSGWSTNTCYKSVVYKNALYTASNKGINIYDFKTDSIFHLFESDGLPSNTVFDLSIYNDTIYAATEAGLSIVPINSIPHSRTFALFSNPLIAHKDTLWGKNRTSNIYTNQQITFVLNALSYSTQSPIAFYYKYKKNDSNYITTQDQNISLSNLESGEYLFEAFAINSDGVQSNTIAIPFYVKPYFYQTVWIKVVGYIALLLVFYFLYMWQERKAKQKLEKQNALENKIRNLEISAWKSAINPHFLFNSLNTMQALFRLNDFEKANKYISEFSSILRKTIDHSGRLLIKISDEVAYTENFLALEKIKRFDNLDYSIEIKDIKITDKYIPSLLIQPILENSLKHGIQDKENGIISIVFSMVDDRIWCTIKDNGKGFDEELLNGKENSQGLKLIKNKISIVEKLIKKDIEFNYKNRYDQEKNILGAETIFSFPLITFDHDISSSNN